MTDRIPTTEDIRDGYSFYTGGYFNETTEEGYAEFDRWLRKVQAEAFNEGASAYGLSFWDGDAGVVENPYRKDAS